MKKLFVTFFILLFSFCAKKERSPYPHLIVEDKDCLQLNSKEMLGIETVVFGYNFTEDTDAKSHVYRSLEESLDTSKENKTLYMGNLVLNDNYTMLPRDTIIPRMDLKVIVDTTYTISRKGIQYKNNTPTINPKLIVDEESERRLLGPYYEENRRLQKKWIECYPVLIYNKSKKAAVVGCQMIQEAKDEQGVWRPIEFIAGSYGLKSCLVVPNMKLFPQKYFGTSIIKYYGDFKTKLRVKYVMQWEVYYSNEFTGYINKSQFSKKPFLVAYNFWKNPYTTPLQEKMDFAFLDYQRHKDSLTIYP